ncbi:MAG TPA: hypothetical protein VMH05_12415 [Bryobacteraceae bacterium]|nr:hypothetical protein [Bryobacteraceae bacterium]
MCQDGEPSSGIHTLSIRWFWLLAAAAAGPALLGQTDPALPAKNSSSSATQSITGKERAAWALRSTFGPASLLGGAFSSGWGTVFNTPREYGTHWEGFGDRYGMRLTGIATSNTMEAGLGAIWGEDPRYFRASGESFPARLGHVVKMAFLAQNKDGRSMPAFARYAAITGSSYLSNTWRVDSDATLSRATIRVGLGFLGRIAGNAWDEFWPDVKGRISRKSDQPSGASALLHD